jgi:hypothetical protein
MYHTQETRDTELIEPKMCIRSDAWLGDAYYFWYDIDDANNWGHTSKKRTGYYDVYVAEIDCENILDTVFNEDHYLFWLKQIERVAKKIVKSTGYKPTLKELNDYFKENAQWDDVDGIMFQDLPFNKSLMVQPITYHKKHGKKRQSFVYRKRIQLAVYNLSIIISFALLCSERCN